MTPDAWRLAYEIAIGALIIEFAFLTLLFVSLHPRSRMEWSTLIAISSLLGVFSVLGYWHFFEDDMNRQPAVYSPLVTAFWGAVCAVGFFTVISWREWITRRE